jgi:hypothetical protein
MKPDENIDGFSKRRNKANISFHQFILMIRATVMLQKIGKIDVPLENSIHVDDDGDQLNGNNLSANPRHRTRSQAHVHNGTDLPKRHVR